MKVITTSITIVLLMLAPSFFTNYDIILVDKNKEAIQEDTDTCRDSLEIVVEVQEPEYHYIARTTVYNPTESQCDSDPLVTADCSRINIHNLKAGKTKWVALSRDLLKKFPYGTTIEVYIEDGHPRNGVYEVHDTMNRRYKNSMDILTFNDKLGKWSNVKIRKV